MPDRVSVLAVLVLYRRPLEDSVTWNALRSQADARLLAAVDFRLLICDNGPLAHSPPLMPEWAQYFGVEENHGLAWAYNRGLAETRNCGADWLLTLDQDTALPADYLLKMAEKAATLFTAASAGKPVGAIVPQLVSESGRVHSPVLAGLLGERRTERGVEGFVQGDVRPFNSGAMMRVTALDAAGGYDRRFWLNYLDHSVFHAVQQAGFAIWIAGDLQVQHHLSLHEGRDRMSEEHFQHFSAAESAFRDLHGSTLEGLLFTARLFLRAVNQRRRRDPEHFLRATIAVLKQRLFLSRKQRIRRWEAEVASMATEPHISLQLRGAALNKAIFPETYPRAWPDAWPRKGTMTMHERVLLVVVLYRSGNAVPQKTDPAEKPRTLRCLDAAFVARPELLGSYDLLLWDNSAAASEAEFVSVPFQYHHAPVNDGVAGAYNGALEICTRNRYEWMLLLDDDTEVSADYLSSMLECRSECNSDVRIAAIAPLLYDGSFQLSPQQVLKHRNLPVSPAPSRILEDPSFAANSGVMMRVSALVDIGGYSLDFWLDYSDIYVFHQLYSAGKRLYLAADLHLQHSMTMLDYDGRMTPERYSNFLHAEQAFGALYKTPSQNAVQLLRLLARVFRQRQYRNKAFSRLTWTFLLYRLSTSKKMRVEQWKNRKTTRRFAGQPQKSGGA